MCVLQFGYSCLTAMPAQAKPFDATKYIGLLWESSTNDCTGTDASCVVKFSVIPTIPYGNNAGDVVDSAWMPYNELAN